VSAKRLRDFLKNEELDADNVTHDSAAGMARSYCISGNSVQFSLISAFIMCTLSVSGAEFEVRAVSRGGEDGVVELREGM